MGKCYNVVLDSNYVYVAGAIAGNSSNQYWVNWDGLMPDVPYKVTFSFITSTEVAVDVSLMGLMVNLGCNDTYVYRSNATMTTSNFLGFLELKDSGSTHYYMANQTTNPAIYIPSRPCVNQIMVQLTNGIDNTSYYSTPQVNAYVLTLHFESLL